jgi:hypothetical protein
MEQNGISGKGFNREVKSGLGENSDGFSSIWA